MATYKDDLDILKAAVKDANKLSLNAITELDNKGILGMYGGGGSEIKTGTVQIVNNGSTNASINRVAFDGEFAAGMMACGAGSETLLNDIVFPSLMTIYSPNLIFQESSSNEIIVTEETTLHVVNSEGGEIQ